MTAAGVALDVPAPEVTAELADAALAAYRQAPTGQYAALEALVWSARQPIPAELRAWAEQIAAADGFPLIGTGLSAGCYPALIWNGAHLERLAPDPSWAPLLAALASADAGGPAEPGDRDDLDRLFRALGAAEAVRQVAAGLLSAAAPPPAWPTISTMAAAAAALLVRRGEEGMARVLDLAASLMVLTPGAGRSAVSGLWAGHCAASGWLAARLPQEAASPMSGSVAHTLSAAAGRGVGASGPTSVADVLARLR